MLQNEEHKAGITGTVIAPTLSPQPLTVTGGEFNLFVRDPDEPRARKMRYRMRMTSEEGKSYFFDGFKMVRDDPGLDMWSDTTTLYITVFEDDRQPTTDDQTAVEVTSVVSGPSSVVVGKGILKIKPTDFARQMTTMQIKNAANMAQTLEANARFGRFFAGALFQTYARLARRGKAKEQV
jgi:cholesterol oxidase